MKLQEYQDRYNLIKEMRSTGVTLKEIGDSFNITRERVRQILLTEFPTKTNFRVLSELEIYLTSVNQITGRSRAREMVRLRDKHTYQDCGVIKKTKDILDFNSTLKSLKGKIKSLDVHHINGKCGKNSVGYDSPKDLSEIITLCHKCHYNRPEHKCQTKEFGSSVSSGWAKNRIIK